MTYDNIDDLWKITIRTIKDSLLKFKEKYNNDYIDYMDSNKVIKIEYNANLTIEKKKEIVLFKITFLDGHYSKGD